MAEQEGAKAEDQFSKGDLVRQQNTRVSSPCGVPDCGQSQEVSRVVGKDGAAFAGGDRQLLVVCCAQVSGVSGCPAIHTVLVEERGEHDRRRFIEVESHCAGVDARPGSSALCSAISRSMASR